MSPHTGFHYQNYIVEPNNTLLGLSTITYLSLQSALLFNNPTTPTIYPGTLEFTMRIRFGLSALVGLCLQASNVEASFVRDVIISNPSKDQLRNSDLLAKAVPLDEYRETLRSRGLHLPMDEEVAETDRRLEMSYYTYNGKYYYYSKYKAQQNNNNNGQGGGDDYYVDSYSFSGYSLKYAKCQPVQRFSEAAIEAGEYSPMVVNDIVILRLCPSAYCSSTRAYGCYYDFAEYAIELTDYIRIMLRYKADRESQLCGWCQSCVGGGRQRRRNSQTYYYYSSNDDGSSSSSSNYYGSAYDEEEVTDDETEETTNECTDYDTYCLGDDGSAICTSDDAAVVDDSVATYLTSDGYLDIIDCTVVSDGYYIRPRCDGYNEALTMGIFFDRFCSQYAGNEIDIEALNIGIDQNYFKEFGSDAGCLDCSESVSKLCSVWKRLIVLLGTFRVSLKYNALSLMVF
jgi:hypothetical protein